MKISTLVAVAFASAAQVTNAVPLAFPTNDNVTESEDPFRVTVHGVGHIHEQFLLKRATVDPNAAGMAVGVSNPALYKKTRQEIRTLYNVQGGRVFDLYILALKRMMARQKSDKNSYYSIAGIHGRPFIDWNGRRPGAKNSLLVSGYGGGYCTHGSTLFPPWHRPYLAYFEQILWANAAQVVATVTNSAERQKWTDALNVLRIPYWDWTLDNGHLPDQVTGQSYRYRYYPNGGTPTVTNPLYAYQFANDQRASYPDGSGFGGAPFTNWPRTLRAPYSQDPGTSSNLGRVNDQLAGNVNSIRQNVHQLLLSTKDWSVFSNHASGGGSSLESIHDAIHSNVGLNGHMSYIEYSSFDPIFFLHHTNVDRIFAMWQAIQDWDLSSVKKYCTSQRNGGGTYGIPPNQMDTIGSALEPFLRVDGKPYNSKDVRDTAFFGYSYPEVPKHTQPNNRDGWVRLRDNAKVQAERLYGGTVSNASKRKRDESIAEGIGASIINSNQYYEWKIDLVADSTALNGSYFVKFFLGKPARDPTKWTTQPEHVGDYSVFTHNHGPAPGIDALDMDTNVAGAVPLTDAMIQAFTHTNLSSLNPTDAIPFLVKNLRWRVSDINGTVHKVRDVKGLQVAVYISLTTLPTEKQPWTVYGDWVKLTDITRKIGKDGGPDQVGIVPGTSTSVFSSSTTSTPPATETTEAATSTDTDTAATSTTEAPLVQNVETPVTTTAPLSTSVEPTSTSSSDSSTPTED
ncbi:Tyrosinase [Dactylellina cionopaga]|nr:Tyrosinase [Dactylellina cionopaga]